MAQAGRGYRVRRLRERRREMVRRGQLAVLAVLAGAVALGAVLGSYWLTKYLSREESPVDARQSLTLLTFGAAANGPRPIACLALFDQGRGGWSLYTLPRTLLLEGSQGEYVMAGDVMGGDRLRTNVRRLVGTGIAHDVRLPYAVLRALAGSGRVTLELAQPCTLRVGGVWRTYRGEVRLEMAQLPNLLGARGETGEDEDTLARAALQAVFAAGALQPADVRRTTVADSVARGGGTEDERTAAAQVLSGLLESRVRVERIPSAGTVNQGQFVFRADRSRVLAEVTRSVPGYAAAYTVYVRNGTGRIGVADAVRLKLAALDVNLPAAANAESFDYRQTEILAGSEALAVAQDIRAILGRGVVLRGENLPAKALVVIVGADLKAEDLQ